MIPRFMRTIVGPDGPVGVFIENKGKGFKGYFRPFGAGIVLPASMLGGIVGTDLKEVDILLSATAQLCGYKEATIDW